MNMLLLWLNIYYSGISQILYAQFDVQFFFMLLLIIHMFRRWLGLFVPNTIVEVILVYVID